jgi:hypothetical protein
MSEQLYCAVCRRPFREEPVFNVAGRIEPGVAGLLHCDTPGCPADQGAVNQNGDPVKV